jgi:hypothetical protein
MAILCHDTITMNDIFYKNPPQSPFFKGGSAYGLHQCLLLSPSALPSISNAYAYDEYQDNDDANESNSHVGEDASGALYHPKENRVYVDGVHREYDDDDEIELHACEDDHAFQ